MKVEKNQKFISENGNLIRVEKVTHKSSDGWRFNHVKVVSLTASRRRVPNSERIIYQDSIRRWYRNY